MPLKLLRLRGHVSVGHRCKPESTPVKRLRPTQRLEGTAPRDRNKKRCETEADRHAVLLSGKKFQTHCFFFPPRHSRRQLRRRRAVCDITGD